MSNRAKKSFDSRYCEEKNFGFISWLFQSNSDGGKKRPPMSENRRFYDKIILLPSAQWFQGEQINSLAEKPLSSLIKRCLLEKSRELVDRARERTLSPPKLTSECHLNIAANSSFVFLCHLPSFLPLVFTRFKAKESADEFFFAVVRESLQSGSRLAASLVYQNSRIKRCQQSEPFGCPCFGAINILRLPWQIDSQ